MKIKVRGCVVALRTWRSDAAASVIHARIDTIALE
jgi:hypothetical protein